MANYHSLLMIVKYVMKRKNNLVLEEIRKATQPEIRMQVELSVAISNKIYDILERNNMTQKDLAVKMGKTETEVSRWLSGTHNFTVETICKISYALGTDIIEVSGKNI